MLLHTELKHNSPYLAQIWVNESLDTSGEIYVKIDWVKNQPVVTAEFSDGVYITMDGDALRPDGRMIRNFQGDTIELKLLYEL